jgi:transcriptional regulator with XRE-family HTH domain
MRFEQIQTRLLSRIRQLIHNGEITERGFARVSGISQPHIHKVLKGARTLSTERFDFLLKSLHCSVLDLFQEDELRDHLLGKYSHEPPKVEVPLCPTPLGPGRPWPAPGPNLYAVPCSLLSRNARLIVVRLECDPSMPDTLGDSTVAALDLSIQFPTDPTAVYAVDRGPDAVLRRVRRGAHGWHLVSDENRNDPRRWGSLPYTDSPGRTAIRGRLVWLNDGKPQTAPNHQDGQTLEPATSSYVART